MPTIAIITALAAEMKPIVRELRLRKRDADYAADGIIATVAGIGAARVTATCRRLVETHDPSLLVLAGFAGGLDPFLRPGYVHIPQQIVSEHGQVIQLFSDVPKPAAQMDPRLPTLLSVEKPALDRATKKRLHDEHKAQAVDMESFTVAQLAADMNRELIVVRTISDSAKSDIPPWAMSLIDEHGRTHWGAVEMTLLQPWRWRGLRQLARDAKLAADSLGVCVAGKIPMDTPCD